MPTPVCQEGFLLAKSSQTCLRNQRQQRTRDHLPWLQLHSRLTTLAMITTTPSGIGDAMRKSLPTVSRRLRVLSEGETKTRTPSQLPQNRRGRRVNPSPPQALLQRERQDPRGRRARDLTTRLTLPCPLLRGLSSVRTAQSEDHGLRRPRYAPQRSRELAFVSSHRKFTSQSSSSLPATWRASQNSRLLSSAYRSLCLHLWMRLMDARERSFMPCL